MRVSRFSIFRFCSSSSRCSIRSRRDSTLFDILFAGRRFEALVDHVGQVFDGGDFGLDHRIGHLV
jgi:hypothetical protein